MYGWAVDWSRPSPYASPCAASISSLSWSTPTVRRRRAANSAVSNRNRERMSTTTWVAAWRSRSSSARRSRPVSVVSPCSTTSVSQKMLAVSASAIGSIFCSGVRWASWVLWYAWPSSCAVVCAASTLPFQFRKTSERSSTNGMQNAPPCLPARGPASIHRPSTARSTMPPSDPPKPRNAPRTMARPSSHEMAEAANGRGAIRSCHGSPPVVAVQRRLRAHPAAEVVERVDDRRVHRVERGPADAVGEQRRIERVGPGPSAG